MDILNSIRTNSTPGSDYSCNAEGQPEDVRLAADKSPPAAEPESLFARLVRAKPRGWMVIGPTDFRRHVTHAVLQTVRAAYTVNVAYEPRTQVLRLQVRLNGLCPPILSLNTLPRLVAGVPLVKITPDFETQAIFVEAATLASPGCEAGEVLRGVVEPLRAVLGKPELFDALGDN